MNHLRSEAWKSVVFEAELQCVWRETEKKTYGWGMPCSFYFSHRDLFPLWPRFPRRLTPGHVWEILTWQDSTVSKSHQWRGGTGELSGCWIKPRDMGGGENKYLALSLNWMVDMWLCWPKPKETERLNSLVRHTRSTHLVNTTLLNVQSFFPQ